VAAGLSLDPLGELKFSPIHPSSRWMEKEGIEERRDGRMEGRRGEGTVQGMEKGAREEMRV